MRPGGQSHDRAKSFAEAGYRQGSLSQLPIAPHAATLLDKEVSLTQTFGLNLQASQVPLPLASHPKPKVL